LRRIIDGVMENKMMMLKKGFSEMREGRR